MIFTLRRRAFTLVELLVVMGIIAILISILLPAVSRAQDQARSAACKSNLRQIFIAAQTYSADNKGSLPYGFHWTRMDSLGNPVTPSAASWVSWFTLLNRTMNPKGSPDNTNGFTNGGSSFVAYPLSKVFRCPATMEFPQQVHYYQHGVAMPHLPMELQNPASRPGPGGSITKTALSAPARFTDLFNENILFWDTPVRTGGDARTGLPFFNLGGNEAGSANNVLPLTNIDGAQLRNPLSPEFRFREPNSDLFAHWPAANFRAMNQTIFFPTDRLAQTTSGALRLTSANIEMPVGQGVGQLVGNVRFRHQRNTVANVVFADGSVQGMTLNKNKVIEGGAIRDTNGAVVATDESYETSIQRKMLLIRWPTGFGPSGDYLTPN